MKRLFVNDSEGRLRAGWRIFIYLVLQMGLVLIANAAIKHVFGGPPEDKTLSIAARGLLVIAIATPAVWTARKLLDRKTWVSLGLRLDRQAVLDALFGFTLSGLMVAVIFVVLYYSGLLTVELVGWTGSFSPVLGLALWMFGIGLAVGWSEEIVFRGYLLQNLRDGIELWRAVALMCVFYGAVHMPNPNSTLLSGTLIAVIGFLRIFGWLRTSQLWLSMGMHAGWNFFQGPVFGFHVSGVGNSTLVQHTLTGPDWLTGGSFGPEAGLVVLPAVLLGLLAMVLWTSKRRGEARSRVPATLRVKT